MPPVIPGFHLKLHRTRKLNFAMTNCLICRKLSNEGRYSSGVESAKHNVQDTIDYCPDLPIRKASTNMKRKSSNRFAKDIFSWRPPPCRHFIV